MVCEDMGQNLRDFGVFLLLFGKVGAGAGAGAEAEAGTGAEAENLCFS